MGIFLAIMAGGAANAGPNGKDVPRVAFLGFEFINTSLEATAPVEVERIRLLDDIMRQKLTASASFEIVDISPDRIKEFASGPTISNCNGCRRKFAQMVGANWAARGTVQKVSNLILNINVYMEDADSGKMKFARSVDIRGNTDESWRRGLDYLLRNYCCASPDRTGKTQAVSRVPGACFLFLRAEGRRRAHHRGGGTRSVARDIGPDCDAPFIGCSQLPTHAILAGLQAEFGRPTWSSIRATAWDAARLLVAA